MILGGPGPDHRENGSGQGHWMAPVCVLYVEYAFLGKTFFVIILLDVVDRIIQKITPPKTISFQKKVNFSAILFFIYFNL